MGTSQTISWGLTEPESVLVSDKAKLTTLVISHTQGASSRDKPQHAHLELTCSTCSLPHGSREPQGIDNLKCRVLQFC